MASDSNPASRLYGLLSAFERRSSDNVSVINCWAQVLGVTREDVFLWLGEIGALIPAIRRALVAASLEDHLPEFDRYADLWASPIYCPDRAFTNPSSGLVNVHALSVLKILAVLLGRVAPEGAVPSKESLSDLRSHLETAIDDVARDDALPADVRALIATRLRDMLWALDHILTLGPDGVKAAAERLAVALNQSRRRAGKSGSWGKAAYVVVVAWTVFHNGTTVEENVAAWSRMLTGLPSIVQEHKPKEIEGPKTPRSIDGTKAPLQIQGPKPASG
jgi:hypothetical protein